MKNFIALILDLLFVFIVPGFIIGSLTGNTYTEDGSVGFNFTGIPALIFIIVIVLYFVVSKKVWGKTPFQKLLKV